MRTRELACALVVAALAMAAPAGAYCRTTTCEFDECRPSPSCANCLEGGRVLYWPSRCLSFAVDAAGSHERGIDARIAEQTIANGFATWMRAECVGGTPSLQVLDLGTVQCSAVGFERGGANLNLWRFRDESWPHVSDGSMLALTTVTYDADSGEILDADVEIDSFDHVITLGESDVAYDLASIVVHETGHFLGLSHSCDPGATMFPAYMDGTTSMRTLEADDMAGVCATFPPGLKKPCAPDPHGGAACGFTDADDSEAPATMTCAAVRPPFAGHSLGGWAGVLAAVLLRRRGHRRERSLEG